MVDMVVGDHDIAELLARIFLGRRIDDPLRQAVVARRIEGATARGGLGFRFGEPLDFSRFQGQERDRFALRSIGERSKCGGMTGKCLNVHLPFFTSCDGGTTTGIYEDMASGAPRVDAEKRQRIGNRKPRVFVRLPPLERGVHG